MCQDQGPGGPRQVWERPLKQKAVGFKEALYFFEKVQKREAGFRDVPDRLAKLRGQKPPDPVPTPSREPDSLALNSAFDALLGRKKS